MINWQIKNAINRVLRLQRVINYHD